MASNALVQTRIDPDIRDRASEVLAKSGLTVSDAVRILLTRTANEGALPMALLTPDEEYDARFRAKVQEALDDRRPPSLVRTWRPTLRSDARGSSPRHHGIPKSEDRLVEGRRPRSR